jgi:hypothetical protein
MAINPSTIIAGSCQEELFLFSVTYSSDIFNLSPHPFRVDAVFVGLYLGGCMREAKTGNTVVSVSHRGMEGC